MNQEIFMKFLWSWPECIVIILQNFFLFFIQPIFVNSNEKILIMVYLGHLQSRIMYFQKSCNGNMYEK